MDKLQGVTTHTSPMMTWNREHDKNQDPSTTLTKHAENTDQNPNPCPNDNPARSPSILHNCKPRPAREIILYIGFKQPKCVSEYSREAVHTGLWKMGTGTKESTKE